MAVKPSQDLHVGSRGAQPQPLRQTHQRWRSLNVIPEPRDSSTFHSPRSTGAGVSSTNDGVVVSVSRLRQRWNELCVRPCCSQQARTVNPLCSNFDCGAGHLARAPAVRKAEHPVPAQVGGKRQRVQGNQISRCEKTGDSPGTAVTHQVAASVVNRQAVTGRTE